MLCCDLPSIVGRWIFLLGSSLSVCGWGGGDEGFGGIIEGGVGGNGGDCEREGEGVES